MRPLHQIIKATIIEPRLCFHHNLLHVFVHVYQHVCSCVCLCVCVCACVYIPACFCMCLCLCLRSCPQYCLELSGCTGQKIKACKIVNRALVEGKHQAYRLSAASTQEQDSWITSIRCCSVFVVQFYILYFSSAPKNPCMCKPTWQQHGGGGTRNRGPA